MKKSLQHLQYFVRTLSIVMAVVFIWRGIWYVLDFVDENIFHDNHLFTAIGGIIIGILILYLPDRDLKEIEKS